MRIKVYFTKPTQPIPVNNQKEVNSYNHHCLGVNNKWHDAFSDYAISSLQGGKLNKETSTLQFEDHPYIVISSENNEVIEAFISGATMGNFTLFGMKCSNIAVEDFNVAPYFDKVQTISPILLKKDNWKLSATDANWLETLEANCIKKLAHKGITDPTFHIEIKSPDALRSKYVTVGEVGNKATAARLYVYGKTTTRVALYNMGLGNSTGSGFGSVKLLSSTA